jgi:hypothetical protein
MTIELKRAGKEIIIKEAATKFLEFVEEYQRERSLTRGQAIALAAREHPKAHERYIELVNSK